jgi:membrane protein YqaA with SNARE-associated domain
MLLLEYGGLFLLAFVAATILPAQSEAVLAGMVISGRYDTALLLAFATAGNVLGSVTNWLLGHVALRFQDRRWFPAKGAALARAEGWYRRWGRWTLLLSWAPIGGDALTVVAGILREPLLSFLLLVTAAKLGRYIVVVALARQFA